MTLYLLGLLLVIGTLAFILSPKKSGTRAAFMAAYDNSRDQGSSEKEALDAALSAVKGRVPFSMLREEDLAFIAEAFSEIRNPRVVGGMLQTIEEGKIHVSTLQDRKFLLRLVEFYRTEQAQRRSSEGLTPTPVTARFFHVAAVIVAWFGTHQVVRATYLTAGERIAAFLAVLAVVIGIEAMGRWMRGGIGRVQAERDQAAQAVVETVLAGGEAEAFFLYLRPFAVTGVLEATARSRSTMPNLDGSWEETVELESVVAEALLPMGPLVALGQPGEHFGAGRTAVQDEDWHQVVEGLMRQAQVILLIPSDRPGTLWEVRRILDLGFLSKTVMIMQPGQRWTSPWAAARREIAELGVELPPFFPEGMFFVAQDNGWAFRDFPRSMNPGELRGTIEELMMEGVFAWRPCGRSWHGHGAQPEPHERRNTDSWYLGERSAEGERDRCD